MLIQEFQSNNLFSDKFSTNMDSNRHCVRRVVPHKEAEFSSGSIMKAMERFVEAVQEMDETILVPSRLMDLEAGASGDTAGLASSTDLYSLYTMVNCVKNELLWGVNSSASCNDVISLDDEYRLHQASTSCCNASNNNNNNNNCNGGDETATTLSPTSPASSHHHHHHHHHYHHHHHHKTHVRRPSTTSVTSTQSVALSDTDSDTSSSSGNENDSGIEGETETNSTTAGATTTATTNSSSTATTNNKTAGYTRSVEHTFRRHLYGLQRSLAQMTAAASYLTKRYQSDIGATV